MASQAATADRVESVTDRASCKAWVARLPNDGAGVLVQLKNLLAHLATQKIAPEVLLEILEQLRSPFFNSVRTRMPECENRAIPLSPREAGLFVELVALTRSLCDLYVAAAETAGARYVETLAAPIERTAEGKRALTPDSPMVFALQQALDLLASITSAHYRARVSVPEEIWDELARLARIAQQADCLDIVPTPIRTLNGAEASDDTCRSAFGYAVMMRLCNPYRMTAQEMSVARYCAIRWGHKLSFRIAAPENPLTSPNATSLMLGQHAVRLDTVRLCSSVRMRMESLRTGKTPAELGFTTKMNGESCHALLERIHSLWSHGKDADVIWRKSLAAEARIVLGLPRLYRNVDMKDDTMTRFLNTVYSYRTHHIDAITYTDEEREKEQIEAVLKEAETWEVLSENAEGFLLARDRSMPRLVLDQLVAVVPQAALKTDASPFLVGRISSLKQEYDEHQPRLSVRHKIGVRLLPGMPRPVGVQIDGAPTTDAYWLEAQPALHVAESLVLPLATFREQREIFMISGGARSRLRLDALLHRGLDFDQVKFTILK